jgi:hypothetical protein
MNFLPEGQKMNNTYRAKEIFHPLSSICYPDRPQMTQRQVVVHVDHVLIHNPADVRKCFNECGLARMEYPRCNPDLASCDNFSFGHLKGKLGDECFPN